jgi:hypothetical protein
MSFEPLVEHKDMIITILSDIFAIILSLIVFGAIYVIQNKPTSDDGQKEENEK